MVNQFELRKPRATQLLLEPLERVRLSGFGFFFEGLPGLRSATNFKSDSLIK